ncbi:MAG TPA: MFS transporter [Methylomirabilota bacterium]|nr:MFS transporter [Methylomirabilota bacterium]
MQRAGHDLAEARDPALTLTRNVVALFIGVLLWTACHFGVLAALPLYLHEERWDARAIGLALGVAGVAQVGVRLFAGWIVDAFGRRVPLVLALVVLSGATALLLAPAGGAILANRVLTGVAFSVGTTAFYTLTVEAAPAARRSEVQGYIALGMTLGIGLGPPVAVAVYQGLSRGSAAPPERLATLAGLTAVVALASGACFLATVSGFRPLGRAHPYSLRTPFRREAVVPAFLNFCAQVPYTAFSAFLPLWAIGRGVGNPGLLFVSSQVGAVASRLLGGRLADRYGQSAVLVPAMIGAAATLAATSLVAGFPAFLLLAGAYGALYAVSVVVLLGLAGEAAPPEGRSAAINTYGLGSDVAQLLGPWGLGLAAGIWGIRGALVVAGAVPLVGAVVYLVMRKAPGPASCHFRPGRAAGRAITGS